MTPELPPGFVMDASPASGGAPPLPPGFVVDGAAEAAPDPESIKMPQRFQSRIAKPTLRLPDRVTNEDMRSALEPRPDTAYGEVLPLARRKDAEGNPTGAPFLTLPGIARNALLGMMDIGEGRYLTDDTGKMVPTQNSLMALTLGAGVTPAYRTGGQIADVAAHGAPLSDLYTRRYPGANRPNAAPPGVTPQVSSVAADAVHVGFPEPVVPPPMSPVPVPVDFVRPAEGPVSSIYSRPPAVPVVSPAPIPVDIPARGPSSPVPIPIEGFGGSSANRLIQIARGGPPAAAEIEPRAVTAAPRSAGAAATPRERTNMTPAETLAERTRAEKQDLMAPPAPGDRTEYVPGVKPTLQEIELSPSVSREAKTLRMERPEPFAAIDRERADAYAKFYDDLAGTETLVLRAKEARDAQAAKSLQGAWAAKSDADTTALRGRIDDMLKGPEGRRSVVERELETVLGKLSTRDGKPITDPEMLYGVRKHINDRLSREVGTTDQEVKLARSVLMDVRKELDGAIEAAAPGFSEYLASYAEASRPINVMEELLAARPRIFKGADRHVAFHDFDRVMKDWVSDRAAAGSNAAKNIPDEQWQQLMGMWRSLQRSAEADRLARAPGSDTTQNLLDLAKRGAVGAAHVAGVATMNPLLNVATHVIAKAANERRLNNKLKRFLAPKDTP